MPELTPPQQERLSTWLAVATMPLLAFVTWLIALFY
jgi:hypothetical protein